MLAAILAILMHISPLTVASVILPECATEDSHNCVWNAQEKGNGTGRSFADINGTVYYF